MVILFIIVAVGYYYYKPQIDYNSALEMNGEKINLGESDIATNNSSSKDTNYHLPSYSSTVTDDDKGFAYYVDTMHDYPEALVILDGSDFLEIVDGREFIMFTTLNFHNNVHFLREVWLIVSECDSFYHIQHPTDEIRYSYGINNKVGTAYKYRFDFETSTWQKQGLNYIPGSEYWLKYYTTYEISNKVVLLLSKPLYDYDNTTIYLNPNYGITNNEPNEFIKVLLPRDGFKDNAELFNFKLWYRIPIFSNNGYADYDFIVSGGNETFMYKTNGVDNPVRFHNQSELTIDGKTYLEGYIDVTRALNNGENFVNFKFKANGFFYELEKNITVTRLEGFIDENGDGLDDRTGRPDGNYLPSDVGTGSALMSLLENKIGTSMLTNSFTAISNMSTVMPPAPTFTIPLADLFDTCVSRFYSGANPFTGKDYTYNFAYLEQMNFMGMSVLNYFRMIISALLVWSTFMYVWEKVIPDKAVS